MESTEWKYLLLCTNQVKTWEKSRLCVLYIETEALHRCSVSVVCLPEQHRHRKVVGESAGVHHQSIQLHWWGEPETQWGGEYQQASVKLSTNIFNTAKILVSLKCHPRKCLELLYQLQGCVARWVHRKCIWMTATKDCTSVSVILKWFFNCHIRSSFHIWCDPIFNRYCNVLCPAGFTSWTLSAVLALNHTPPLPSSCCRASLLSDSLLPCRIVFTSAPLQCCGSCYPVTVRSVLLFDFLFDFLMLKRLALMFKQMFC